MTVRKILKKTWPNRRGPANLRRCRSPRRARSLLEHRQKRPPILPRPVTPSTGQPAWWEDHWVKHIQAIPQIPRTRSRAKPGLDQDEQQLETPVGCCSWYTTLWGRGTSDVAIQLAAAQWLAQRIKKPLDRQEEVEQHIFAPITPQADGGWMDQTCRAETLVVSWPVDSPSPRGTAAPWSWPLPPATGLDSSSGCKLRRSPAVGDRMYEKRSACTQNWRTGTHPTVM